MKDIKAVLILATGRFRNIHSVVIISSAMWQSNNEIMLSKHRVPKNTVAQFFLFNLFSFYD